MAVDIKLDSIMKQPLSRKLLILAGVNLLIAVIIYQFFWSPKQEEVNGLRENLKGLSTKLDESRTIAKDIPKFEQEREELEEKLKEAVAQLPNEKEIPDLIDSISEAGRDAGLKILLFKPVPEVPRGFYAEVPVSMAVEGRYESIFLFADEVGKLPRIVNIGGIKVDAPEKELTSQTPTLNASFVTTTFRFIPGKGISKEEKR
jgi:type IV pilus assembly protein PilO